MMFINVMNEDIFDVTFSIYLDVQKRAEMGM